MGDVITMIEQLVNLTLDLGARADMNIVGEDVRRHRPQALRQTPDMDIVYAQHALHLGNLFYHRLNVHIARRGFEQNIHCIAQDAPGVVQDEETDQDAYQGIEPVGIREVNDHTCNDRTDCRQHIAHQMDKGGTQVKVMLTATVHKQGSHEVDYHRNQTHANQDA